MGNKTTQDEPQTPLGFLGNPYKDAEEVRRRDALAQAKTILEKMQRCVEHRLGPDDDTWPTGDDYWQLLRNVIDVLDPKARKRRYPNARWQYAFAAVDNANENLSLKDRIKRFAIRATEIVEQIDLADVPSSVAAVIAYDFESPTEVQKEAIELFRRALHIADGKVIADGSRAVDFFDRCPAAFRAIYPSERIDGVPQRCRPLAEYATAAEITRVHRAYFRDQFKWLSNLGEFLSELGSKDFDPLQDRIALLTVFNDAADRLARKKQRQNREANRRFRASKQKKS